MVQSAFHCHNNKRFINPPSKARGGYTKAIQGLEDHFSHQNDHNSHLAIIKLIHFPDAPNQKLGVQNDRLDKVFKTEPDNNKKILIFMPRFLQNVLIDFSNFRIFRFRPFLTTIYYPSTESPEKKMKILYISFF